MKKIFLSCLLLLLASITFSQEKESAMPLVDALLKEDLYKNEDVLSQLSLDLTGIEKYILYVDYKKDATLPFVLNTFLGYGIGSFVQRDFLGGGIALAGGLIGTGLITYGAIVMPLNLLTMGQVSTGIYTLVAGGIIIIGTRIFEMIRPLTYAKAFNEKLEDVLGLSKLAYSALPTYDFEHKEPVLIASVGFKL